MEIQIARVTVGDAETQGNMQVTFPGTDIEMLNVHCDALMLLCDLVTWQNTINRGTKLKWDDVKENEPDAGKSMKNARDFAEAHFQAEHIQIEVERFVQKLVSALRNHALFPITLTVVGGKGVERAS